MRILGIIASSLLKRIADAFTRTTSGSLGTTDTGQPWVATRGTWYANGSAAQSDDSASNNSIASVTFNANPTASSSVSNGTGVAFWVTDANNWFATVSYQTQSSYTCNCSTGCNTCTYASGTCVNCTSCSECGTTYTCSVGCVAGSICQNCSTGAYIGPATANCNTCTYTTYTTGASCPNCGTYSYNCQTCYNNAYYMRLLKSVSGTVSTVISDVSLASAAAALKVVVNNGSISEYAYSDTAMTTQIGTASTTPSSPSMGSNVGIIKTTTQGTQGSTVDNFSVQ